MEKTNGAVRQISIRETEPVIKKIRLLEGGRDGLEVTYVSMEIRNSVLSKIETNKKQKRPVQKEIRNYFQLLREHLLSCAGFHWSNDKVLEMLNENTAVTWVLIGDSDQFMIGGRRKVCGTYTIALNSALMKNEDYDGYDELGELIKNIVKETKMFMNGQKGADSRQVTVDYLMLKKDMPDAEHEFDKMSAEEQKQWMTEAFENYGLEVVEEDGQKVLSTAPDKKKKPNENQEVPSFADESQELHLTPDDTPIEKLLELEDDFTLPS